MDRIRAEESERRPDVGPATSVRAASRVTAASSRAEWERRRAGEELKFDVRQKSHLERGVYRNASHQVFIPTTESERSLERWIMQHTTAETHQREGLRGRGAAAEAGAGTGVGGEWSSELSDSNEKHLFCGGGWCLGRTVRRRPRGLARVPPSRLHWSGSEWVVAGDAARRWRVLCCKLLSARAIHGTRFTRTTRPGDRDRRLRPPDRQEMTRFAPTASRQIKLLTLGVVLRR